MAEPGAIEQDTPPRVVIVGAGAVGRGFIGELFADAGWTVSFLDVQPDLIGALQRDGSYLHRTIGAEETVKTVAPVVAGYSTDRDRVVAEVAAASCLATSVGARVLPLIAPVLRDALLSRYAAGGGPLDILLCENLHGAGAIMRDLLVDGLDDDDAALLLARTGLVETSIGRMIPAPGGAASGSVTDVAVEPYRFLPIDVAAAKTEVFAGVPGFVLDRGVNFAFYSDRKLYVHNMGHFLCALLGRRAGVDEIWQAMEDPTIRYLTRAAMIESAMALSVTYGHPAGPLVDHVDDLLHRFANRALGDTVERVARDPQRKMEPGDRVLGAHRLALAARTPSGHLAVVVALGAVAWERSADLSPGQVDAHVAAALAGHDAALDDVRRHLAALRSGAGPAETVRLLGARFDPPVIP